MNTLNIKCFSSINQLKVFNLSADVPVCSGLCGAIIQSVNMKPQSVNMKPQEETLQNSEVVKHSFERTSQSGLTVWSQTDSTNETSEQRIHESINKKILKSVINGFSFISPVNRTLIIQLFLLDQICSRI